MKLYQYDDLKKANQALGSFKRNGIEVKEVSQLVVENKVVHFILTESVNEESDEKENGKTEKKAKAKTAKTAKGGEGVSKGETSTDAKAEKAESVKPTK